MEQLGVIILIINEKINDGFLLIAGRSVAGDVFENKLGLDQVQGGQSSESSPFHGKGGVALSKVDGTFDGKLGNKNELVRCRLEGQAGQKRKMFLWIISRHPSLPPHEDRFSPAELLT
jgi:hypothetical protein